MSVYKFRPEYYAGMLEFINDGTTGESLPGILQQGAGRVLLYKQQVFRGRHPIRTRYKADRELHAWLKRNVQPILDRCDVKIQAVFREIRELDKDGQIVKSRAIRIRNPFLAFEPKEGRHFYDFLELCSDDEAVARFTKCPQCSHYFLAGKAGGRKRDFVRPKTFCSPKCGLNYHNSRPDHKAQVAVAVKRSREKKARKERNEVLLGFFKRRKPAQDWSASDWQDCMMYWNEQCGRKRTWVFTSATVFRRTCRALTDSAS